MIRPASPDEPPPAVPIIAGDDVIRLGHLWWLDWTRQQLGDLEDMADRMFSYPYPTYAEMDLRNTLTAHALGPDGNCLGAHLDGRHTWPCATWERTEAELDAMTRATRAPGVVDTD